MNNFIENYPIGTRLLVRNKGNYSLDDIHIIEYSPSNIYVKIDLDWIKINNFDQHYEVVEKLS